MSFMVSASRRISSSVAGWDTRRSRPLTLMAATSARMASTGLSARRTTAQVAAPASAVSARPAMVSVQVATRIVCSMSARVVPTAMVTGPAGLSCSVTSSRNTSSSPDVCRTVISDESESMSTGRLTAHVGARGDHVAIEDDLCEGGPVVGNRDVARCDAARGQRAEVGGTQRQRRVDVVDHRSAKNGQQCQTRHDQRQGEDAG